MFVEPGLVIQSVRKSGDPSLRMSLAYLTHEANPPASGGRDSYDWINKTLQYIWSAKKAYVEVRMNGMNGSEPPYLSIIFCIRKTSSISNKYLRQRL